MQTRKIILPFHLPVTEVGEGGVSTWVWNMLVPLSFLGQSKMLLLFLLSTVGGGASWSCLRRVVGVIHVPFPFMAHLD